jgi:hypothetical protein
VRAVNSLTVNRTNDDHNRAAFGSGHGGWEARSWAPAAAILYRRGRNRVENAMGAKQTCVYQKCARLCVSPQHTNTHTHTRTHTARVYCAMQLAVSSKRCCERSLAPWLPAGRRCSPTAIPFAHAYMRAYTRSLQPSTHAHTNTHLHTHTHTLSLSLSHTQHSHTNGRLLAQVTPACGECEPRGSDYGRVVGHRVVQTGAGAHDKRVHRGAAPGQGRGHS